MRAALAWCSVVLLFAASPSFAAKVELVEIPTRPGVTQRFVVIAPEKPKAAVILFSGGNGWIKLEADGHIRRAGNFLVRSRQLFADHGLMVAVVDAPSDHQQPPYLNDFRDRPGHVADIKAVMAWLRKSANVPVWLVGTSRGTQSAAFIATQLVGDPAGPDGIVLTSTILNDNKSVAVPELPLQKLQIPTLVVHHRHDGCDRCPYREVSRLMKKLTAVSRKELLTFEGGVSEGDSCEAKAYHGYNGLESDVVARIAEWIVAK